MNAAAAHEALFGDALACDEFRPVVFLPGAIDDATSRSLAARGEALLRALAVVEDGGRSEEPEPTDYALHRLEAKLDLLTALVAGLARSDDTDPLQELQWSAHGACLAVPGPLAIGVTGRFRIQPADWLPSPLVLPATVIACDSGSEGDGDGGAGTAAHVWLRFGPLSPALEAALERHLFRVHRRAIAESHRSR